MNPPENMKKTSFLERPPSEHGLVKTLNKMGFMMEMEDSYRRGFIEYALQTNDTVLEIGAAYGVVAQEVLMRGGKVIANDLEERHLRILEENIPKKYRKHLQIMPGKFPNEINLQPCSVQAILASQVLHFLNAAEIESGFEKISQWLKPGGKFFAIASTPYVKAAGDFYKVYEERKKKKQPWPGYVNSLRKYSSSRYVELLPESMNFLDIDILIHLCEKVNFKIEKIEIFGRPDFLEDFQLDGRENVGLIAMKR